MSIVLTITCDICNHEHSTFVGFDDYVGDNMGMWQYTDAGDLICEDCSESLSRCDDCDTELWMGEDDIISCDMLYETLCGDCATRSHKAAFKESVLQIYDATELAGFYYDGENLDGYILVDPVSKYKEMEPTAPFLLETQCDNCMLVFLHEPPVEFRPVKNRLWGIVSKIGVEV